MREQEQPHSAYPSSEYAPLDLMSLITIVPRDLRGDRWPAGLRSTANVSRRTVAVDLLPEYGGLFPAGGATLPLVAQGGGDLA